MGTTGRVWAAMSRAGQCPLAHHPRCHLLSPLRHLSCHPVPHCHQPLSSAFTPSLLPCPVPVCAHCDPVLSPTATSCPQSHLLTPQSPPVCTALVPTVTACPHYIIPCPHYHPLPHSHFKSPLHHPRLQCHPLPSVTACPQCLLLSPQSLPAPVTSACPVPSCPRVTPCLPPLSHPVSCHSLPPLSTDLLLLGYLCFII